MNSNTTPDPRWGTRATVLWSAIVLLAFVLVQSLFFGWYVTTHSGESDIEQKIRELQYDGDVIAISTLLTTVLCIPMIFGIVHLKKGARLDDYLPMTIPPGNVLLRWLGFTAVFILASDALSLISGNPIVPDFMKQAYSSTDTKLLLWIALVVAAPAFEETFFRGFMVSGFSRSRLGLSGAVLVSAALWAIIHVQYDWYGVFTIFAFGLFLGAARVQTGSLATPMLIHAVANSFASFQAGLSN